MLRKAHKYVSDHSKQVNNEKIVNVLFPEKNMVILLKEGLEITIKGPHVPSSIFGLKSHEKPRASHDLLIKIVQILINYYFMRYQYQIKRSRYFYIIISYVLFPCLTKDRHFII